MTKKHGQVYTVGLSENLRNQICRDFPEPFFVQQFSEIEDLFMALSAADEGIVLLGPDLNDDESVGLCGTVRRQTEGRNFRILLVAQNENATAAAIENGADDVVLGVQNISHRMRIALKHLADQSSATARIQHYRIGHERVCSAADSGDCGLWSWNLQSNTVWYSRRWQTMLALPIPPGDQLTEWLDRVHPHDAAGLKQAISNHRNGDTELLAVEFRIRHSDGSWRWFYCRGKAIRTPHGEAIQLSGSFTDVTDRRAAEEQVLRGTFYDQVTELPNRALVLDRVWCALERAKRGQSTTVGLLHLELDRFRLINTSLGHDVGNLLLQAVARRLQSCMRYCHSVARIGDDEFAVLLEELRGPREALLVARRIQEQFASPFHLGEREVFVGVRIGIAVSTARHETPDELLRDAESALRRAKNNVTERCQIFDEEMQEQARQRLTLETELRKALSDNELLLHYQPVVDLDAEKVRGFEALLRWNHPTGKVLGVGDFFGVAEESGLVVPIGYWVLDSACAQLKAWHQYTPEGDRLAVGINLSVKQLLHCELIPRITETMAKYELSPKHLWVEVTEQAFVRDPAAAQDQLRRLKNLGIRISYDDFGGEGSTISHLDTMPIDELKLDRSFASRMDIGGTQNRLVKSVVMMASELGMDLVVKGMETERQCDRVRQIEGALGQGYYLSKPLSADAITAFLQLDPHQLIGDQERHEAQKTE